MLQPHAACTIGHDTDRGSRLDGAEMRPVRQHAVPTVCHRAGDPRRFARRDSTTAGRWWRRGLRRLGRWRRELCRCECVGRQRVRESLEHESLRTRAGRDLAGVDVALGVDRQVMQSLEVPRLLAALAELIEELETFPFEHQDVRVAVVGDVEELLIGVGGECQAGR